MKRCIASVLLLVLLPWTNCSVKKLQCENDSLIFFLLLPPKAGGFYWIGTGGPSKVEPAVPSREV